MERIAITPRSDWQQQAEQLGFKFHTIHGEPYWDESAYYRFNLKQIEQDIEDPTAEIHGMCLELVSKAVADEQYLQRLHIPEAFWDWIRNSWNNGDRHLYGRIDLAYDGRAPAKFYEYNADTPTSLYESGFFQWIWLEQMIESGLIPSNSDQFNSLQDKLVSALQLIDLPQPVYFSCCKDSEEDRGTVQYLQDCAVQAGLESRFIYIEDIGLSENRQFTDLDDYTIPSLFKLYPWEWMLDDEYGEAIADSGTQFIEPVWKALLSNKGILPLLWELFPNHPNLLPAYFESEPGCQLSTQQRSVVRKPLFSREGNNISIHCPDQPPVEVKGPYQDSPFILQAYHPLPRFEQHYTLIGSWLVGDQPAGMGIREDKTLITQDTSRFIPHVIAD